ncbi:zinc finger protein Eos isoform X1 [Paramormyrops kingsleyae]|uniref:zinc finger protein Eos isoform X1 n=1 Tax=Paramormyrops kingsleyae TaxID=1676925 RepID=UPI000CD60CD0|nr:zinc finger protein Eos-like isoform X1 [Paramormyrops kingsleyae]XP_023700276.1 zinc finger protein Eos-like isoform X2 [Paramormyrops kingsleyae]XP_023700277.1 zinc finger protein Eos-like isoform X1 [Paramormyrops kingsleyae]XP_023700278.1 zinc finger protein Eos-like isoform X1 [Paramormyrops kingsleyae]XP_023700279.1 zinc finger protein Eos-like isoform X1 [Paramormyrops kingsleyae]XP_023700280.1 zinc finger protein Eos-like isoform X1 [Paramormyrops kingsleyae]XP_023700281.1 zinc fin
MNADDCNGRSYMSGSGDSSMERDFSGGMGGATVSTPNSQHSSPSRSLSANSIKVELYNDDQLGCIARPAKRAGERDEAWKDERLDPVEGGGLELGGVAGGGAGGGGSYGELASPEPTSPGPIRLPNGKLKCDICGMVCIGPNVLMVHKRSHTALCAMPGERPFQCNQCGASFTQKGNLLRHIKLHSGEKPFKCPFCSYACRRRDALTGHLRTHSVSSPTVGKPYKCSYCGRSYKQQSTLEEHRERCHGYLQSLEAQPTPGSHVHGEEMRDVELVTDPLLQPSTDKLTFIDRLANSITKRKRSTPQKFVGQKHMRLSTADGHYEHYPPIDKDGDELSSLHRTADSSNFTGVISSYLGGPVGGGGGQESIRSLRLPPQHPASVPEFTSVISSFYNQLGQPGQRTDSGGGVAGGVALGLGGREAGEGHEDLPPSCGHVASPSNGCQDSTDTESTPEEQPAATSAGGDSEQHPTPPVARSSGQVRESDSEPQRDEGSVALRPGNCEVRVVDSEGRPVRSFRCTHCRVLFLDHVMFTIHMGCHGFRQPFECNICGHRSQDRYEFSSHIVRGEHTLG